MGKNKKNSAEEPLSKYGKPATFENVWEMFQETNKQFHETDRRMNETDRRMKETDRQMKETDRKIDRLAKFYGGVSENSRDVAEEFFRIGLESRNELYGISYDQIGRLQKKTKKLQGEFDIVLYNGELVIVIEVKYKLHPNDVQDFLDRKLPAFKPLFPEYDDKKIIGAVAGMSVPQDSCEKAEKNGLLVLTQSGDNIAVMNTVNFSPKMY